jgi:carbon-monoxide dehydrogenase medium subunit
MRPAELQYTRALSVEDLGQLLRRGDGATPMAGGQGLMRDLRGRTLSVGRLVDISRLTELAYVREDGDALEIGAVTTLATVAGDPLVTRRCPALATAASRVADVQIRSRGTVGGNICGSWVPSEWSNDVGVVLTASGGQVLVQSSNGQRTVAAAEFTGAFENPLAPGEFIRALRFGLATGSAYVRLSRRWADSSIGSAAAFVDEAGGRLRVGLAVGRIHHRTAALDAVARAVEADGLDSASVTAALQDAAASFTVPDTVQADADYRRSVLPVVVRRAVREAMTNGGLR